MAEGRPPAARGFRFVNGRPLASRVSRCPRPERRRRDGAAGGEFHGPHSHCRGRGSDSYLGRARAQAGRPRGDDGERRRAGARCALPRERRLRAAVDRYPHAGDGRHRAGARGRAQASGGDHPADDWLRRPARACARPRCVGPRRHRQAVLARHHAPRGERRAQGCAAADELSRPRRAVVRRLEIPQQPLDIVELELRAEGLAEAPAQLLENAPRALHVDLARHLDRGVVAVVAPAQRPPERIGLLLSARRSEPAGLAVEAGSHHALLLHRLGEVLRTPAQRLERAALRIDRAVGVALAELAFRIAHGLARAAELIHLALALALPLLVLAEALLAQLLHQLAQLVAQRLLVLAQLSHLVALLALLTLLTLLAALPALAVAPLVLTLLEGAVAQLLLLADHVAELVERRHHVVVAVAVHLLAGTGHLQVLQHLLELLQHPARGVLGAGAGHLLEPVDHVAQILRAQGARIGIERPGELLRILAHLLGQRLQELVERGAQLVGEPLDLLVVGAALQRLAQRFLCRAQRLLGIGHAAVLEMHRHVPHARDHVAQLVVALGARQLPEDRAQTEIDVGLHLEAIGRQGERIERGEHARLGVGVERQDPALLDQRARDRLGERPLRQAEFERHALALVAGLVARAQDHRHVDAGPGMLGQILGRLPDAVLGAGLRQHQRVIGRAVERARRVAVGAFAVLQPELRLRADDAVVVFQLVGELQRAARLPLRVLGERNGRRLVGNGGELPGDVARGGTT